MIIWINNQWLVCSLNVSCWGPGFVINTDWKQRKTLCFPLTPLFILWFDHQGNSGQGARWVWQGSFINWPYIHRGQGETEERSRLLQIGKWVSGSFNKQWNLLKRFVSAGHKMRSLYPPARIIKLRQRPSLRPFRWFQKHITISRLCPWGSF